MVGAKSRETLDSNLRIKKKIMKTEILGGIKKMHTEFMYPSSRFNCQYFPCIFQVILFIMLEDFKAHYKHCIILPIKSSLCLSNRAFICALSNKIDTN